MEVVVILIGVFGDRRDYHLGDPLCTIEMLEIWGIFARWHPQNIPSIDSLYPHGTCRRAQNSAPINEEKNKKNVLVILGIVKGVPQNRSESDEFLIVLFPSLIVILLPLILLVDEIRKHDPSALELPVDTIILFYSTQRDHLAAMARVENRKVREDAHRLPWFITPVVIVVAKWVFTGEDEIWGLDFRIWMPLVIVCD